MIFRSLWGMADKEEGEKLSFFVYLDKIPSLVVVVVVGGGKIVVVAILFDFVLFSQRHSSLFPPLLFLLFLFVSKKFEKRTKKLVNFRNNHHTLITISERIRKSLPKI